MSSWMLHRADIHRRFRGACCPHRESDNWNFLLMETVRYSETSVSACFYCTVQHCRRQPYKSPWHSENHTTMNSRPVFIVVCVSNTTKCVGLGVCGVALVTTVCIIAEWHFVPFLHCQGYQQNGTDCLPVLLTQHLRTSESVNSLFFNLDNQSSSCLYCPSTPSPFPNLSAVVCPSDLLNEGSSLTLPSRYLLSVSF